MVKNAPYLGVDNAASGIGGNRRDETRPQKAHGEGAAMQPDLQGYATSAHLPSANRATIFTAEISSQAHPTTKLWKCGSQASIRLHPLGPEVPRARVMRGW